MTTDEIHGRSAFWLLLSVLVVLVDQASKLYIVRHFMEFEFIRLLPVLDITRMHNVGAAFSFLASASGWQRWVFIGLAVVVSLGIIVWLVRLPGNANRLLAAGLALVLGGGQLDRPHTHRLCRGFHSLPLGTRLLSRLQRGGFGDHGGCGVFIIGRPF
jgi:lipoprotein signal peptidase